MKKFRKLLAIIMMVAGLFLNHNKSIAQCWANSYPFGTPNTDELQTQQGTLAIMQGYNTSTPGTPTINGVGINTLYPNYILDILGNYIADGVNVSCSTCATLNAVGYSIADSMILWHAGDLTSIYGGVRAGFVLSNGANYNAFYGYKAGYAAQSGAGENTCIGAWAAYNLTTGVHNTTLGYSAGMNLTTGEWNTVTGIYAGYSLGGCNWNCFYGKRSGYSTSAGNNNAAYGAHSFHDNVDGGNNTDIGCLAGYENQHGNANVAIGYYADYYGGNSASPNSQYNVMIGSYCGASRGSTGTGNGNVLLGSYSDMPDNVGNAIAIGYTTTVMNSSTCILGNNTELVGIGLSSDATGPQSNLEICTHHNNSIYWPQNTPNWTTGYLGWAASSALSSNQYGGEGYSGLKFTDLTSNSAVVDPSNSNFGNSGNKYPTGVLSVDGYGNVIYVHGSGTGAGYCSSALTTLTGNAGYNLNNAANFIFQGNGNSDAYNSVIIGNGCTTPRAKLDVYQNSTTNGSVGAWITNMDPGINCGTPAIGLYSEVLSIISATPNVAGFFNAPGYQTINCNSCGPFSVGNFAIAVPEPSTTGNYGGYVGIGVHYPYDFNCSDPATEYIGNYFNSLLSVNGSITASNYLFWSDSTLKNHITNQSSMINKVKSLRPVTYQFKKHTDTNSSGTHYGFIAQEVDTVFPNAVRHFGNHGLYALSYNDIVSILTKAFQEQLQIAYRDSIAQKLTNDSLRTRLNNMESCINELCNEDHSSIHHNSGNNTEGEQSPSNIQDVSLSSSNAPLLYQNTPNPFSTGTKINYYLPEGTMGATIVFIDSYGNQLKVVTLPQTGNGTLNVAPDNLAAGIYSYSLVVNGKVIDTKRMILQK